MRRLSRTLAGCTAALLAPSLLSGCALLLPGVLADAFALKSADQTSASAPPVAPQTAIALELYFVERPPGDLLMQDALWNELDQIATVPPETRDRLRQNGFRFGVVGANPPYALRSLMAETGGEIPGRRTLRREYSMSSGVAHQFPCQTLHDAATVRLATSDAVESRDYTDARCVVRCQVEQTQPGWARLEILPEIHHGESRLRPVANDHDWDYTGGQLIDPLYGQQFSVELNEGESVVLGGLADDPQSPGARFFHSGDAGRPAEKLLVIRLKSMNQVAPVRQTGW